MAAIGATTRPARPARHTRHRLPAAPLILIACADAEAARLQALLAELDYAVCAAVRSGRAGDRHGGGDPGRRAAARGWR